jgi:heparin binding hemagglutinin HbhA
MTVMAIADDLRKALTDPKPLYFAAGTADLAVERARQVPELIEQLRADAPDRIDALRRTDPRAVQARAAERAREAQAGVQAKVNELVGSIDPDPKKLRETAQGLALRGVGTALQYAVKARETYERVAERGEHSVRAWRGQAAEDITDIAVAVEPDIPDVDDDRRGRSGSRDMPVATEPGTDASGAAGTSGSGSASAGAGKAAGPAARRARTGTPRKAAPRKAASHTPRKAAARKTAQGKDAAPGKRADGATGAEPGSGRRDDANGTGSGGAGTDA